MSRYGGEAWILLSFDAAVLIELERMVLRKIFGPVFVGEDFRIGHYNDLFELLNDKNVMQHVNI